MKILLVNATRRRESTYRIARILVDSLPGEHEVREVFLPEAMPEFCTGCGMCFMESETKCPHYTYTRAFLDNLEWARLLIFATPVYVFHTTGQMKALLDHYGFMWMVHRPSAFMFQKQAVVISTAAGAGMRSANKDIRDSLTFWGVGRTYCRGYAVQAVRWSQVSEKRKKAIRKDMEKLAFKILPDGKKRKPCLKVRFLFSMMRMVQRRGGLNGPDVEYWENQGWLGRQKPYGRTII